MILFNDDIINSIQDMDNPILIANKLTYYVTKALKSNEMSLYESYLLNGEILRLKRQGYTQPGWNGKVGILICMSIVNQRILAVLFSDSEYVIKLYELGLEAFKLNGEKRSHYLMGKYEVYLKADESVNVLERLASVRRIYSDITDENGPFHIEAFPYQYYSPEEILLDRETVHLDKKISKSVEDLLVELSMK